MATYIDLAAEGFTSSGVEAQRLNIDHPDPLGRGPFCRLTVTTTAPSIPGVYSWVVDGDVQYVGKARSLLQIVRGARMNAAYNDYTYMPQSKVMQTSSPRVRVNGLLNRAITTGKITTWWWRATDTEASALQLEAKLIQRWNPPWNRARPLVTSGDGEAAWLTDRQAVTQGPPAPLSVSAGGVDDLSAVDTLRTSVGWRPLDYLKSRDKLLLARLYGDLVGAMLYWFEEPDIYPDPDRPAPYSQTHRLKIVEVLVTRAARRRGVGRALVREAARIADAASLPWMWAWPSPNGPGKQVAGRVAFFAACGMHEHRPDDEHLEMIARTSEILAATRDVNP